MDSRTLGHAVARRVRPSRSLATLLPILAAGLIALVWGGLGTRAAGAGDPSLAGRALPDALPATPASAADPSVADPLSPAPLASVTAQAAASPTATPDLFGGSGLRDLKFTIPDPNWLAALDTTDERDVEAELEVDGLVYRGVGVRIKGYTSAKAPGRKKPLNVSMDAFAPKQRLYGHDTFNLNNGYSDPTLVREVVALDALRPFVPSQRASFARVHVNGDYLGLYVLTEQVDKTFLGRWFGDPDGLLFKADDPAPFGPTGTPTPAGTPPPNDRSRQSNLTWQGEALEAYKKNYELKSASFGDEGYLDLRELIRLLAAPPIAGGLEDDAIERRIGSVLDVDAALWYLAANNVFMNYDSYYFGHNYFLYREPASRQFALICWDLNTALGAFPLLNSPWSAPVSQVVPLAMNLDPNRPLIRRLLAVPRFKADYLDHYATLSREALDVAALEQAIRARRDLIHDAVYADRNLLYDLDRYEANLNGKVQVTLSQPNGQPGGPTRDIEGLLPAIRARAAFLAGQRDLERPASYLRDHRQQVTSRPSADQLRVELEFGGVEPAGVDLVYRVDGAPETTAAMAFKDGAWSLQLTDLRLGSAIRYYARAAYAENKAMFFPAANLTQPWHYMAGARSDDWPRLPEGGLAINELMADNQHTLADAAGDFDDWIELVNRSDRPQPLAGYFLSDDLARPYAYGLPGRSLSPGERLLVWCDDDPEQGPEHAPFKLDKAGETVWLLTREGIADEVRFSAQTTDTSLARLPDGLGPWAPCSYPSPGTINLCQPSASVPTPTPWSTTDPTPIPSDTPSPSPSPTPTAAPPVWRAWLPWAGRDRP